MHERPLRKDAHFTTDVTGLVDALATPPAVWSWQVTATPAELEALASALEQAPANVQPTVTLVLAGDGPWPDAILLGRLACRVARVEVTDAVPRDGAVAFLGFLREVTSYDMRATWSQADSWGDVHTLRHLEGPREGPEQSCWPNPHVRWQNFARYGPGFVNVWDWRSTEGEEIRITIDDAATLEAWRRGHGIVSATDPAIAELLEASLLWSDGTWATVIVPRVRRWPVPSNIPENQVR